MSNRSASIASPSFLLDFISLSVVGQTKEIGNGIESGILGLAYLWAALSLLSLSKDSQPGRARASEKGRVLLLWRLCPPCQTQSLPGPLGHYPTLPQVTVRGKMMAAGVDLIIQSRPRQASWMAVKRWTLLRDTCRKSRRSGWCFAGINNSCTLFVN